MFQLELIWCLIILGLTAKVVFFLRFLMRLLQASLTFTWYFPNSLICFLLFGSHFGFFKNFLIFSSVLLFTLRRWRLAWWSWTTSLSSVFSFAWFPEKSQMQRNHQSSLGVCSTGVLNTAEDFKVAQNEFQISSKNWRRSSAITYL